MKKSFFLILACVCVLTAQARVKRDTTSVDIREYTNEPGYFQKANRDLNDPRFMFHDDKTNFDFGVGGTVEAACYYGFNGALPSSAFTPDVIAVPTDRSNMFGTKIGGSELHAKARVYWKNHKVTGYIKFGGDSNNKIELKEAYISFDGFSIGKIPSFFTDLEFGVMGRMTVSTQSDVSQPLVGYTYRHKKGWEVAVAIERANLRMEDYSIDNVNWSYQTMPDITAHVKYRWDKGHVQLGGVLRRMTYCAYDSIWAKSLDRPILASDGKNMHVWGYGVSLSGNYKPTKGLTLSAIVNGGKGIAKYTDYCSDLNLDLGYSNKEDGNYQVMEALPLASAAFSAQYEWQKKFSTAVQFGYARCFQKETTPYVDAFKSCTFASANVFYYIKDWAFIGLEYLYGKRTEYADPKVPKPRHYGHSNRVVLVGAFMF